MQLQALLKERLSITPTKGGNSSLATFISCKKKRVSHQQIVDRTTYIIPIKPSNDIYSLMVETCSKELLKYRVGHQ